MHLRTIHTYTLRDPNQTAVVLCLGVNMYIHIFVLFIHRRV